MKRYLLLILTLLWAMPAFAQSSPEELRAREIGHQLRCVVCQNQSIEESDAQLAEDMRKVVRDQIANGSTDEEVISFIRDSYGDYVLLKPPVQPNTYLLWFLPGLMVLFGLIWIVHRTRQENTEVTISTLSDEDQSLLDRLMKDNS